MSELLHVPGGRVISRAAGFSPAAEPSRRDMGLQIRAAPIEASTVNSEARTVEVVWSTGIGVRRYDWDSGRYYLETLSLDPAHVRLDRLNSGAPVLDTHDQYRLSSVLGCIEHGTARIDKGRGVATLRIGQAPDIDPIWARVEQGLITKVSVGYRVYTYQVTRRDGEDPEYLAVDWEPMEVSLVALPADPDAAIRSDSGEKFPVEIIESSGGAAQSEEEDILRTRSQSGAGTPAPQVPPPVVVEAPTADQVRTAVQSSHALGADVTAIRIAERERITGINSRAAALGMDGDFVRGLIDNGVDLDVASTRLIDEHARRSRGATPPPPAHVQSGADHTDPDAIRGRMSSAIVARAAGGEVPEAAREFVGYSMLEMGIELARARGMRDLGRRMSPAVMYDRLTERAHTTSDFPLLMTTSSHAILLGAYQRAAPTYRRVMGRRDLPDFKPMQMLRVGDFPGLLEVGEEGEYQYGTVGESGESITLASWGRILKLGRRLIINDELGAFAQVTQSIGGRVSRFENSYAWGIVKKNPKLSDGKAIFHADHKNSAAAAAIDATSLDANQQAVMTQKDMDDQVLNMMPRYLAVGADKLTEANKAIAAITPTKVGDYNPFAGQREVVGDAEIEANTWYEFVDPTIAPAFVYSYLTGLEGPRLTSREGFTTDGIDLKVALDFAVGAVDHRPVYRRK